MTPSARPWIGGILLAASLLALVVAPVMAADPATLTDPGASPRSGDVDTRFTLEVTYTDPSGHRPMYVRVRVAGDSHRMRRAQGRDVRRGVVYRWSGRLPKGEHGVTFSARSRDGLSLSADGGNVKVGVVATPEPKPTAKPKPTTKPKPKPAARPRPKPTAKPQRSAPRSTPKPAVKRDRTPAPTPEPTPVGILRSEPDDAPGPTPSPTDPTTAVVLLGAVDERGGSGGPDGTGGAGTAPTGPAGDGVSGADDGTWGPLASLAAVFGLGMPTKPVLPLMPTVVTTSGVAAASMALGLFGRRRRDEGQPESDEVMAAAAAEGIGVGEGAIAGLEDDEDDDGMLAGPDGYDVDSEALMPRWRRPSLLQARRADPMRANATAPRLAFDQGFNGSLAGTERRLIRYTVVRLLDAPDELRGREIGALQDGDEVELLEKQGVYWLVACPDGGRGWIHKMTLGAIVGAPVSNDVPSASLPIAAETWTMGEADVDDDVLAAYLESRQRAG